MSEEAYEKGKRKTRMSTKLATKASNNTLRNRETCTQRHLQQLRSRRGAATPSTSDSESEDECENVFKLRQQRTPTKQKSTTSEVVLNEISPVTPPKQKKGTPNGNENIPNTPSTLLGKLTLISPNSKHNTQCTTEVAHPSNRRKLFKGEPRNKLDTEDQNSKEEKDHENVLQDARKALFSSFPSEMPGREKEHDELREFISDHMENETAASLYISGPPGTGKTASLNVILQENYFSSGLRQVYINCTAIKSANSVFSKLIKELKIKVEGKSEKENLNAVQKFIGKGRKMILLVLDEIDQLETKNQSILYTIFEWPSKPKSRLILIGIANALDLTDRILPRLQARCELKPTLMHFSPYSKQQIVDIFTSRLKAAGVLDVFSPVALQLLAGKVAAVSGDVRRALDIGRRVIELVDQNKKDDILKPIENLAVELVDKERKKDHKTKSVELKQVFDVLNNVYGTAQNLTDDTEDSMPLQQKIIICSLLLLLRKARSKDITIGKLHEVYSTVCTKRNILAVGQAEFVGLCSLIETKGIIKVSGKKESRLHKISLEWNEKEVADALKDKQLMSSILQDDGCLGRL